MKDEVRTLLASADRALEAARVLIQHRLPPDAANRIYYAMFYAAQALLPAHGIEVSKDSAVEGALGFHFAKTGKMKPAFHRLFINARKIREFADYGVVQEMVEPRSDLGLDEGRNFVEETKRLMLLQKDEKKDE